MSDVDDLVAALIKGDPDETVPTPTLTKMAQWAIWEHWIPCPHTDFVSEYVFGKVGEVRRTCQRCGAPLTIEPENTNG
jgi:hypothetical protein